MQARFIKRSRDQRSPSQRSPSQPSPSQPSPSQRSRDQRSPSQRSPSQPSPGQRSPSQPGRTPSPPTGEGNPGWTVFSYLLSGMILYGGIGWVIGHWVWHSFLAFPLGMLAGLLLAIFLVYYRFGRS